ncbi:MAG: hypothetical protein QM751_11115 [Paludibacteraceae bacterium]
MTKKILIVLFFFMAMCDLSYSQAYDGAFDNKFFVGYTNVNGFSGLSLKYDLGFNKKISFGINTQCVFAPKTETIGLNDDKYKANFDLGCFLRYHFLNTFKLPSQWDPYLGMGLGFNSADIHAGVKYLLNEKLGFFCQYSYSYASGFCGILEPTYFSRRILLI